MSVDFDKIIDRGGTGAIKYDFAGRGVPEDTLSLWVADMDFASPDCVQKALLERVRHGVYGYTESGEGYWQALEGWMRVRFGWEPRREWVVTVPGVVFALSVAVRAYTGPGDAVLIQQPVYYPFAQVVNSNGRELVVNRLVYRDGSYRVDYELFERQLVEHQVKLFVLCSPHNPVGRVWREEELRRMGEICRRHGVLVVSDEIHMDFVRPGHRHRVFADLGPELAAGCLVLTAPSKTFNLAGLQCSNVFIPDERLRKAYRRELESTGYDQAGIMGLVACEAAYKDGGLWLDALLAYLEGNLELVRRRLEAVPGIRLVEPEGTYLVWLDCEGLGLEGKALDRFMLEEAKLWLDAGHIFGAGGERFVRINIASPRSVIGECMDRLERAVRNRT